MRSVRLKVARIGNSRGIRLPAATLARYHIGLEIIMEEQSDGIFLRPPGQATPKLSWEDTAREMATEQEDWSEWDATLADGLDAIPWEPDALRVAEPKGTYKVTPTASKGRKKKR